MVDRGWLDAVDITNDNYNAQIGWRSGNRAKCSVSLASPLLAFADLKLGKQQKYEKVRTAKTHEAPQRLWLSQCVILTCNLFILGVGVMGGERINT